MAFTKRRNEMKLFTLILIGIPFVTSLNIDCKGRSFRCVNSTHFMICVDLGGGVSMTVDDFMIPCPPSTACNANNRFECEFQVLTTPLPKLRTTNAISEPTTAFLPLKELSIITVAPVVASTKSIVNTTVNKTSNNEVKTSLNDNGDNNVTDANSIQDETRLANQTTTDTSKLPSGINRVPNNLLSDTTGSNTSLQDATTTELFIEQQITTELNINTTESIVSPTETSIIDVTSPLNDVLSTSELSFSIVDTITTNKDNASVVTIEIPNSTIIYMTTATPYIPITTDALTTATEVYKSLGTESVDANTSKVPEIVNDSFDSKKQTVIPATPALQNQVPDDVHDNSTTYVYFREIANETTTLSVQLENNSTFVMTTEEIPTSANILVQTNVTEENKIKESFFEPVTNTELSKNNSNSLTNNNSLTTRRTIFKNTELPITQTTFTDKYRIINNEYTTIQSPLPLTELVSFFIKNTDNVILSTTSVPDSNFSTEAMMETITPVEANTDIIKNKNIFENNSIIIENVKSSSTPSPNLNNKTKPLQNDFSTEILIEQPTTIKLDNNTTESYLNTKEPSIIDVTTVVNDIFFTVDIFNYSISDTLQNQVLEGDHKDFHTTNKSVASNITNQSNILSNNLDDNSSIIIKTEEAPTSAKSVVLPVTAQNLVAEKNNINSSLFEPATNLLQNNTTTVTETATISAKKAEVNEPIIPKTALTDYSDINSEHTTNSPILQTETDNIILSTTLVTDSIFPTEVMIETIKTPEQKTTNVIKKQNTFENDTNTIENLTTSKNMPNFEFTTELGFDLNISSSNSTKPNSIAETNISLISEIDYSVLSTTSKPPLNVDNIPDNLLNNIMGFNTSLKIDSSTKKFVEQKTTIELNNNKTLFEDNSTTESFDTTQNISKFKEFDIVGITTPVSDLIFTVDVFNYSISDTLQNQESENIYTTNKPNITNTASQTTTLSNYYAKNNSSIVITAEDTSPSIINVVLPNLATKENATTTSLFEPATNIEFPRYNIITGTETNIISTKISASDANETFQTTSTDNNYLDNNHVPTTFNNEYTTIPSPVPQTELASFLTQNTENVILSTTSKPDFIFSTGLMIETAEQVTTDIFKNQIAFENNSNVNEIVSSSSISMSNLENTTKIENKTDFNINTISTNLAKVNLENEFTTSSISKTNNNVPSSTLSTTLEKPLGNNNASDNLLIDSTRLNEVEYSTTESIAYITENISKESTTIDVKTATNDFSTLGTLQNQVPESVHKNFYTTNKSYFTDIVNDTTINDSLFGSSKNNATTRNYTTTVTEPSVTQTTIISNNFLYNNYEYTTIPSPIQQTELPSLAKNAENVILLTTSVPDSIFSTEVMIENMKSINETTTNIIEKKLVLQNYSKAIEIVSLSSTSISDFENTTKSGNNFNINTTPLNSIQPNLSLSSTSISDFENTTKSGNNININTTPLNSTQPNLETEFTTSLIPETDYNVSSSIYRTEFSKTKSLYADQEINATHRYENTLTPKIKTTDVTNIQNQGSNWLATNTDTASVVNTVDISTTSILGASDNTTDSNLLFSTKTQNGSINNNTEKYFVEIGPTILDTITSEDKMDETLITLNTEIPSFNITEVSTHSTNNLDLQGIKTIPDTQTRLYDIASSKSQDGSSLTSNPIISTTRTETPIQLPTKSYMQEENSDTMSSHSDSKLLQNSYFGEVTDSMHRTQTGTGDVLTSVLITSSSSQGIFSGTTMIGQPKELENNNIVSSTTLKSLSVQNTNNKESLKKAIDGNLQLQPVQNADFTTTDFPKNKYTTETQTSILDTVITTLKTDVLFTNDAMKTTITSSNNKNNLGQETIATEKIPEDTTQYYLLKKETTSSMLQDSYSVATELATSTITTSNNFSQTAKQNYIKNLVESTKGITDKNVSSTQQNPVQLVPQNYTQVNSLNSKKENVGITENVTEPIKNNKSTPIDVLKQLQSKQIHMLVPDGETTSVKLPLQNADTTTSILQDHKNQFSNVKTEMTSENTVFMEENFYITNTFSPQKVYTEQSITTITPLSERIIFGPETSTTFFPGLVSDSLIPTKLSPTKEINGKTGDGILINQTKLSELEANNKLPQSLFNVNANSEIVKQQDRIDIDISTNDPQLQWPAFTSINFSESPLTPINTLEKTTRKTDFNNVGSTPQTTQVTENYTGKLSSNIGPIDQQNIPYVIITTGSIDNAFSTLQTTQVTENYAQKLSSNTETSGHQNLPAEKSPSTPINTLVKTTRLNENNTVSTPQKIEVAENYTEKLPSNTGTSDKKKLPAEKSPLTPINTFVTTTKRMNVNNAVPTPQTTQVTESYKPKLTSNTESTDQQNFPDVKSPLTPTNTLVETTRLDVNNAALTPQTTQTTDKYTENFSINTGPNEQQNLPEEKSPLSPINTLVETTTLNFNNDASTLQTTQSIENYTAKLSSINITSDQQNLPAEKTLITPTKTLVGTTRINVNNAASTSRTTKPVGDNTSKLSSNTKPSNGPELPIGKSGFKCPESLRGRYGDNNDCQKFYICVGHVQPVVRYCPNNTVFSEIKTQCTRNLSHCTRNKQFHCPSQGRFVDLFKENIYYICVKGKQNHFVRFTLQCQNGYHLNKTLIKCIENIEKPSSKSTPSSTPSSSTPTTSLSESISTSGSGSKSMSISNKNKSTFECEDEGKFPDPNDCRKYYVCTLRDSKYRRKIKKCDNDEIFDKEKKKCIEDSSHEC